MAHRQKEVQGISSRSPNDDMEAVPSRNLVEDL
jgi:hypothetical protein